MRLVLIVLFLAFSSPALAEGFQPFVGNWRGTAIATTDGGKTERLTCVAYNTVAPDSGSMKITIRCANATGAAMRVAASIRSSGGTLSGTWSESTYNIGGAVSGSINGSKISSKISSPNWNAGLQVSRTGEQLAISVSPTSGAGRVNISMRK